MSSYPSRASAQSVGLAAPREHSDQSAEGDKPPPASALAKLKPQLDITQIPLHLRELLVHAQSWGVLPEPARRRRVISASEHELHLLADAIGPFLSDIDAWTSTAEASEETSAYRALAAVYAQIEARLTE